MKIIYESQKNLHNLIYESDGKMFLRVDEENNCEKSNINMIFDLGVASNEKSEKIRKLLYLLTAHKDGGLYTLVRRAFEEDRTYIKPPIKDEYFSGFSGLHAVSTGVMILVGILTLILCMIFVKKGEGVEYRILDKFGIALNFAAMLFVLPIIYIAAVFVQAYKVGPDWIYQAYLCVPQIAPFSIAASLALRRKGFRKIGFCIQFLAPVAEVILMVLEYVL